MNLVAGAFKRPLVLMLLAVLFIYFEVLAKGMVPLPGDTLVGSYYPWLDYKWGTTTGVPVKNSITSDTFSQFFIWKYMAMDQISHGQWPLWNPYSFSGTPLLASFHSATLFPANLLLLLPRFSGWSIYILLSTLTAALGMYLFLGHYTDSPWARAIGGLIYGLAGPMTTWAEFGTGVWSAAMFVFVFWCVDMALVEKKQRYLAGVSLFTLFTFLAGHVQIATYLSLIYPLYVWWVLHRLKAEQKIKKFLVLCLSFGLGVGAAAVQIFPTLDYFQRSIRQNDLFSAANGFGLSPWSEMIRLWASDFFGNPATHNDFGVVTYHEYSSFLGTLALPLVLPLLQKKFNGRVNFFLALFAVIMVLAFNNPLSAFIYSLPLPLLTYSAASRVFFVLAFVAAILVSGGLDHWGEKSYRRSVLISSLALVLLTLVYIAMVDPAHRMISVRNSIIPFGLLMMLASFALVGVKKNFVLLVLFVVFAFDLGRYFRKYNQFVPADYVFPRTPILETLIEKTGNFRVSREFGPVLPPNTWAYYKLPAVEGYDPMRLLTYNRFFHLVENKKYFNLVSRYSELEDVNPKFLSAMGVKFFMAVRPEEGKLDPVVEKLKLAGFKLAETEGKTEVYENPAAAQRAYFVRRVVTVSNEDGLAAALEAPGFDPKTTAVLVNHLMTSAQSLGPGEIKSLELGQASLKATTSSEENSFLVITNAYDKGWKATIDGKPSSIVTVDGALQGLLVPGGRHEVALWYLPDAFVWGLVVSAISVAGMGVFWRKRLLY